MAAIPVWLTGRYVTAYVITGQTVAADGNLADATTTGIQPLAGVWSEIDLTMSPSTEEISASDSTRQHTVIIQEASRIRMSTILQKNLPAGAAANTVANPLAHIASAYDVFKIVFTRGGKTWTAYFTRGEYSEGIRKGRTEGTLSGEPLDPGSTNPLYATAA